MKEAFKLDPQSYKYSEDMLARNDIDGVMIATGDFPACQAMQRRGPGGQGLLRGKALRQRPV